MKNLPTREAMNVYLAHGEFNISQFNLRQSLTLERHNTTIEFGILQNNYFIRFQKDGTILSEICTTKVPVFHTENISITQNVDQGAEMLTQKLPFAHYTFESFVKDIEEGNTQLSTLQSLTNAEHVYKLTHHFPNDGALEGDRVELYLDVSDIIQLQTVRIRPSEEKMLFTTGKLVLI